MASLRPRLLVAALLSLLLAPGVASAEAEESGSSTKLVFMTVAGSQATLSEADDLADRLIRQVRGPQVVVPSKAREILGREGGDAARQRAERTAKEARRELRAFEDLDRTATLLDGAIEAYFNALPLLPSLDEPLRLLIDLATVELARDRGDRLTESMSLAVRLDPVLDLDPQELPSRLVEAAREAREQAGEEALLSEGLVRRVGEALACDGVIVVQPRPGPHRALVELYDCSNGARRRSWLVSDDDLGTVAEALSLPADEVDVAEIPEEPEDPEPFARQNDERDVRRPWYQQWWLWTLVGAVVLGGAAVGTYYGVTATSGSDELGLDVRGHF